MSRTVTAMYDTRAEAEAARDRLSSAVDVEGRARIIDKSSMGSGQQEQGSGFHSVPLSHEDRHSYGEGLNRGGFLLCAEVDDDEDSDRIISILEETSSVDMDERETSWRNEGWAPYSTGATTGTTGTSDTLQSRPNMGTDTDRTIEEEHIPIVEEQLHVGKREVNRGGARVRSHIRETPVHEAVNLREEHVSVERRPVDQRLSTGGNVDGDLLRERNIEMTETQEVPMVSKEARVAEELVVKKTATERTEDVEDTVSRTEVDVDEGTRGTGDRSALFGRDEDETSSTSRTDFERSRTDRDL